MEHENTDNAVAAAIKTAGSQIALAEALGVSQQAVSSWLAMGYVPLERAREIEAMYGIPRAQLINPRIAGLMDLSPAVPDDLTVKD